jgi:hypothetical protein
MRVKWGLHFPKIQYPNLIQSRGRSISQPVRFLRFSEAVIGRRQIIEKAWRLACLYQGLEDVAGFLEALSPQQGIGQCQTEDVSLRVAATDPPGLSNNRADLVRGFAVFLVPVSTESLAQWSSDALEDVGIGAVFRLDESMLALHEAFERPLAVDGSHGHCEMRVSEGNRMLIRVGHPFVGYGLP